MSGYSARVLEQQLIDSEDREKLQLVLQEVRDMLSNSGQTTYSEATEVVGDVYKHFRRKYFDTPYSRHGE